MSYKLSIENETYPVEDIHFQAQSRAPKPAGTPISFISPVRLTIGQRCVLLGEAVGYQLLINTCSGFTFTPRYLVSGILADQAADVASAA